MSGHNKSYKHNQQWTARAPSNIALIKYMGKTSVRKNKPTNASLSYTLTNLYTEVRIHEINDNLSGTSAGSLDQWRPLKSKGFYTANIPLAGQERYLKHFDFLKKQWGIKNRYFVIESANNFPSDCGLASSASSFAALTMAAAKCFQDIKYKKKFDNIKTLSSLSRQGSGSSCRSFYTPWALWKSHYAEKINLPYQDLIHLVLVVEEKKKIVSSSAAHKLVSESSLFKGRPQRANRRLKDFVQDARSKNWQKMFQICWDEFWDMHNLFHTSKPPFFYMNHKTMQALQLILNQWIKDQDGPLVTMDAGPNIHLLFRPDQAKLLKRYKKMLSQYNIFTGDAV